MKRVPPHDQWTRFKRFKFAWEGEDDPESMNWGHEQVQQNTKMIERYTQSAPYFDDDSTVVQNWFDVMGGKTIVRSIKQLQAENREALQKWAQLPSYMETHSNANALVSEYMSSLGPKGLCALFEGFPSHIILNGNNLELVPDQIFAAIWLTTTPLSDRTASVHIAQDDIATILKEKYGQSGITFKKNISARASAGNGPNRVTLVNVDPGLGKTITCLGGALYGLCNPKRWKEIQSLDPPTDACNIAAVDSDYNFPRLCLVMPPAVTFSSFVEHAKALAVAFELLYRIRVEVWEGKPQGPTYNLEKASRSDSVIVWIISNNSESLTAFTNHPNTVIPFHLLDEDLDPAKSKYPTARAQVIFRWWLQATPENLAKGTKGCNSDLKTLLLGQQLLSPSSIHKLIENKQWNSAILAVKQKARLDVVMIPPIIRDELARMCSKLMPPGVRVRHVICLNSLAVHMGVTKDDLIPTTIQDIVNRQVNMIIKHGARPTVELSDGMTPAEIVHNLQVCINRLEVAQMDDISRRYQLVQLQRLKEGFVDAFSGVEKCAFCLDEINPMSHEASGVAWKIMGTETAWKIMGTGNELFNDALAEKLLTQTEFSDETFDEFNIKDLKRDNFIKVGASYYIPDEDVLVNACCSRMCHARCYHIYQTTTTCQLCRSRRIMGDSVITGVAPNIAPIVATPKKSLLSKDQVANMLCRQPRAQRESVIALLQSICSEEACKLGAPMLVMVNNDAGKGIAGGDFGRMTHCIVAGTPDKHFHVQLIGRGLRMGYGSSAVPRILLFFQTVQHSKNAITRLITDLEHHVPSLLGNIYSVDQDSKGMCISKFKAMKIKFDDVPTNTERIDLEVDVVKSK